MMKNLAKSLSILVLVLGVAAQVRADDSEAREDDIRRLLEISGSGALATQMLEQIVVPLEQAMPQVPDEFWGRLRDRFDTGELADMIVPVYARHFDHDEIRDLIAFYESPIGQKVVQTMPAVMQESFVIGQSWGAAIGRQIVQELKAEGFELPTG